MESNAGLPGNYYALDEEWMPFPEELDILRREFIALKNFVYVVCMTLDKENKQTNKNHLLGV